MEQLSQGKNKASYNDFLSNLEEKFLFHQEGKPLNYRYNLIKFALDSVKKTDQRLSVSDFVDGTKHAKDAIAEELHQINEIRMLDEVMETLRVVAKHTKSEAARSKEATIYVESLLRNNRNN